ncbi:malto-oligosyltrehalose synthase [Microbacterium hominis]|uniref:malto-oligosyltrehalose synthase n=1 Tax=Microbacterium TaxID=33882 RepID=UPI00168AE6E5|nr:MULTISPECIES: malto-oligosyltrehalose synthase [Microbacterium]QOC26518.1 malto-oligosyltrehalose synthase [Microbacterium hominis]QOC27691.1 malto-oligosyltrehalose synthase [Microbacterium hominis]QYF97174.1 malto-oligosyltrehalose synthase [Microbacterium sp. PAMC21962]
MSDATAPRPASTYRLQVRASFDLDAAATVTDYLRDLGVDWAYLSPILQAAAGSDHGYDVVDPTRVDADRGGPGGLSRFVAAARDAGLGILVDIVPNHQGVADPTENPWWWDVLTHGRRSAHAAAFDIDWEHGAERVVLPVLGGTLDEVLGRGEIEVAPPAGDDDGFGTARYYELVLPLAPGTAPLHATTDRLAVRDVLERQHWRVTSWRRDAEELNYRRFFTVTSLAGVRVELPEVFAASHREILRWVREGLVDGLRIDHPDGLADPGGYLDALAAAVADAREARSDALRALDDRHVGASRSAGEEDASRSLSEARSAASKRIPVYVEKILEPGEELPGWWATDGTTGYDALGEIDRVLVDPAGAPALTALDERLRGGPGDWHDMIGGTKREIADTSQAAEVGRLIRCLPDAVRADLGDARARDAFAELLAAFPVYRAYLPAGRELLADAVATASERRPDLADALVALAELVADADAELSRRFMQTTGPVTAKGVEDRAFYRYARLTSLTEVGGDPSRFALDVAGLHAAFARRQASWPHTLTALTTHDTKRSEDVRARLSVLAEIPGRWAEALDALRAAASTGDGPLDALLWQAVVGAWSDDPALPERLHGYAEKAAREGGVGTSWTDPDEAFEARVHGLVDAAFASARPTVEALVAEVVEAGRSNSLSAKLLQLAGPGVPDVYQGTELWDLSLVDPDNRRPVDFAGRRALLARLDDGWMPPLDGTGGAKLLVVSRTLRLRRDRPDLFTRYTPLPVVGAASAHAVAFDRGGAIAVATRLSVGLAARGGWGDTAVLLPARRWRDAFTGRELAGGAAPLAVVLADLPVALLVAAD